MYLIPEIDHIDAFDGIDEDEDMPQIDFLQAFQQGKEIQFLEQAFEWHIMSYNYFHSVFLEPQGKMARENGYEKSGCKF